MTFENSLGISAIVRLKRRVFWHQAGAIGMIIDQAPNGRDRYRVMFPGTPFPLSLSPKDLDLVQGLRNFRSSTWWEPDFDVWAALRTRVAS